MAKLPAKTFIELYIVTLTTGYRIRMRIHQWLQTRTNTTALAEMEGETEFNDPLAASTPKKRRTDSDVIAEFDNTDSILFYSEENTDSLLFYSADTKDESILFYSPTSSDGAQYSYSVASASSDLLFWDSEEPITMTISQLLQEDCCHKGCLKYLSPAEVGQARDHFTSKTREEQRQYLLDCAIVSTVSTSSETSKPNTFTLFGKTLCKKAFVQFSSVQFILI